MTMNGSGNVVRRDLLVGMAQGITDPKIRQTVIDQMEARELDIDERSALEELKRAARPQCVGAKK